jgi:hypothetical protein
VCKKFSKGLKKSRTNSGGVGLRIHRRISAGKFVVERSREASQVGEQTRSSVEGHFFLFVDFHKEDGWTKSSEEVSRSSVGRWILRRCKEVTAEEFKGSKLRRGRALIQVGRVRCIIREIAKSGSREKGVEESAAGVASLRHAISRVGPQGELRKSCGNH